MSDILFHLKKVSFCLGCILKKYRWVVHSKLYCSILEFKKEKAIEVFLVNRNKLRGKTSKVLFANLSLFYTGLKFQHAFVGKVQNTKSWCVVQREAHTACMS